MEDIDPIAVELPLNLGSRMDGLEDKIGLLGQGDWGLRALHRNCIYPIYILFLRYF